MNKTLRIKDTKLLALTKLKGAGTFVHVIFPYATLHRNYAIIK